MSRPTRPIEVRLRTGRWPGRDSGGRKVPRPLVAPIGHGPPPAAPGDLSTSGALMWGRLWAAGSAWLHPDADWAAVSLACHVRDCLDLARSRYRHSTLPADARMVVGFSRVFTSSLVTLGFDPAARARLGVTEVRRVSELDRLIHSAAQRRADS